MPSDESVARHVFDPTMFSNDNVKKLIDTKFFTFSRSNGAVESLVWTRFAPDPQCVHSIGTQTAKMHCKAGRMKQYVGYRRAQIRVLRDYVSDRGHRLKVEHAPDEGMFHAHISYQPSPEQTLNKNDKAEIRMDLLKMFDEEHKPI